MSTRASKDTLPTFMPRSRALSAETRDALRLLGSLVRRQRLQRRMRSAELAARAGISRTTLVRIEQGAPGTEIGVVFEVALLVGVPLFETSLFETDAAARADLHGRIEDRIALLPARIRERRPDVDDDF